MPLFKCQTCGCVENTALGDYWNAKHSEGRAPRCSECGKGKWHGRFPKEDADAAGYIEGNDGFIYKPAELAPGGYFHNRAKPANAK